MMPFPAVIRLARTCHTPDRLGMNDIALLDTAGTLATVFHRDDPGALACNASVDFGGIAPETVTPKEVRTSHHVGKELRTNFTTGALAAWAGATAALGTSTASKPSIATNAVRRSTAERFQSERGFTLPWYVGEEPLPDIRPVDVVARVVGMTCQNQQYRIMGELRLPSKDPRRNVYTLGRIR